MEAAASLWSCAGPRWEPQTTKSLPTSAASSLGGQTLCSPRADEVLVAIASTFETPLAACRCPGAAQLLYALPGPASDLLPWSDPAVERDLPGHWTLSPAAPGQLPGQSGPDHMGGRGGQEVLQRLDREALCSGHR